MNAQIFLFGTLRYLPLLECVLGRELRGAAHPAQVPDFEIRTVRQADYPCLTPVSGAVAEGLCLKGLSDMDRERLAFYEACFGYDLNTIPAANGKSFAVFMPTEHLMTDGPWSLENWAEKWGDITVRAAQEVMSCFGNERPEAVGQRFPVIRVRAASYVRAQAAGKREVHAVAVANRVSRGYDRFFAVEDMVLTHRSFDDTRDIRVERAVFLMADAVTVLPYDPKRDVVLVIEQFRAGIFARGDRFSMSLEPIAGRIDPGETPEATAHREAREEAGLAFEALELISQYYPSPGGTSEYLISYLGIADLPADVVGISGVPEEGEDIRSHVKSFDDFMSLINTGQSANGPLVLSGLWLAQNRSRLRREAGATA